MEISKSQLEHLQALQVASAKHKKDKDTRREWQWEPKLAGPVVNTHVLEALLRRRLARWIPAEDNRLLGGRYCITQAGREFLATQAQ